MVNQDIVGGLRSALARGYSIDEAVKSFANAGYKQKDIEEASQMLQSQIAGTNISPQPIWTLEEQEQVEHKPELEFPIKQKPVVLQKQFTPAQPKQVVTKGVAAYTNVNVNTAKITTITIVLIILLVVLLGILGLMYLFRTQIIDFFNSLF